MSERREHWIDLAVELAEATAGDGKQRALDVRFASWDEVKLAADAVRDAIERTDFGEHVQPWRWRTESTGEPLTEAGRDAGWELRFSRLASA